MTSLRFGVGKSISLGFADGVAPEEYGRPQGDFLADPVASVIAALDNPVDYPSLALCTTPGDHVVLALDRRAPRIAEAAGGAVHALVKAGIAPDGITVLLSSPNEGPEVPDPCRLIAAAVRHRMKELIHDPADRRQLAYLAADEKGEPIMVNRALHDADFILPIGCLRSGRSSGYFGIHDNVFPLFSDERTLQRFRCLGSMADANLKQSLIDEVERVAWLLGVHFTVQLVPASGNELLHVLAGQSDAVRKRSRALYDAAWTATAPRASSLVVAAIEGDASQQTWENVGLAAEAAGRLVEDGGDIAICCELAERPGSALQRLSSDGSREHALHHIGKDRPKDALVAGQLANALHRNKVYLLSRLEPSVVEDLDMVPVGGPEELARLVQRHRSCILLSNAPYASVTVEAYA
jgi:nickel-dependent lactate racemase